MVSKTLRQPALCPAPASLLWCAGLPEAAAAAGGCSGRGGGCCCSLATSLAGSLALAWPGERCFSHLLTSGLVAGEAGSWHTENMLPLVSGYPGCPDLAAAVQSLTPRHFAVTLPPVAAAVAAVAVVVVVVLGQHLRAHRSSGINTK